MFGGTREKLQTEKNKILNLKLNEKGSKQLERYKEKLRACENYKRGISKGVKGYTEQEIRRVQARLDYTIIELEKEIAILEAKNRAGVNIERDNSGKLSTYEIQIIKSTMKTIAIATKQAEKKEKTNGNKKDSSGVKVSKYQSEHLKFPSTLPPISGAMAHHVQEFLEENVKGNAIQRQ